MKKEKILIIGAGINQLAIIKKAKNLNYYVIVVTPFNNDPGIDIADEVIFEDIFNKEKIYNLVKNMNVCGVISDLSDIITPTVAYLAERLGLPTFGYNNSLYFTNKAKTKEVLRKLNLSSIPNKNTKDINVAIEFANKIKYPIVIKPVDSYSSRGVYKIYNELELKSKFYLAQEVSRAGEVIVEKYINGPQYFSQGFVNNKKLNLFAYSDRYYFNIKDLFIPYTNIFPAKVDLNMKNRIYNYFNTIIDYLKPSFGIVWAEWILDKSTDTLYMVEMAIRGAGACVTTDIIPLAYGIDLENYLIKAATGKDYEINFNEIQNNAAGFYCFLLPEGIVKKVEGIEDVKKIEGVKITNLPLIREGDIINKWKDKSSRFGPIVVFGKNRYELEIIRNKIINTLNIEVLTEDGIKNIIWE